MMAGLAASQGDGSRVGVLAGGVDFAIRAAADGSGPLFFRGTVAVLNLHQLGTGCDFAVDVDVHFGVKARGVVALVALHVGKQGGLESAAAGACNADSGGRVPVLLGTLDSLSHLASSLAET